MSAAIALASLILLALGWFALRWTEESRRMDDLIATVLSTPLAGEDEICTAHGCDADYCSAEWCQR